MSCGVHRNAEADAPERCCWCDNVKLQEQVTSLEIQLAGASSHKFKTGERVRFKLPLSSPISPRYASLDGTFATFKYLIDEGFAGVILDGTDHSDFNLFLVPLTFLRPVTTDGVTKG